MAPRRSKDSEDNIDKRYTRRPQVVLRTLPPILFSSPNGVLTFQLTMSLSGVKAPRPSAPQLDARPSYERDFGVGAHEEYAKPQVVKREFERVNSRIDEVKKDLKAASETLDEKFTGLETRLTTEIQRVEGKVDDQKTYLDDKFNQHDKKYQERLSQLQLNLSNALNSHYESVAKHTEATRGWLKKRLDVMDGNINTMDKRFDVVDDNFKLMDERFDTVDHNFQAVDQRFDQVDARFSKVDERFNKVDERFNEVDNRLNTIEEEIGDMKDDMKDIKDDIKDMKHMLMQLLQAGGIAPTVAASSSQIPFRPEPAPRIIVHNPPPPVARPSSPSHRRQTSATNRDAASVSSRGSEREQIASVFRSIQRKVSRGFGLLNKSKERLDQ